MTKTSFHSSKDESPSLQPKELKKKVKFTDLKTKVVDHSRIVQLIPLKCMDPKFYDWKDDEEFTK